MCILLILVLALNLSGCTQPAEEPQEAEETPQEEAAVEYPTKPINYILPFDPGGESDITARIQQQPLEDVLGYY